MILDEVDAYLGRFVAFPSDGARHAVTLWVTHTHLLDCFDSTPRLVLTSPEKQSGKTRCLEIISLLVPNELHTTSVTPAALFRMIDKGPTPTVLFDEYDTMFGHRPTEGAEDLRALINAGHRRGVTIPRCVPPSMDPKRFSTFAAVALAGIGELPDTITDRSVLIPMRRRSPGEQVEPFRIRKHEPPGIELGGCLAEWAIGHRDALDGYEPETPLEDRPADVWEPLLAIGDHAGDLWATRARNAAQSLTAGADGPESLGVELLRDIRYVWPQDQLSVSASELLKSLKVDGEMRWAEHRGGGLSTRSLSQFLKPFGIRSHKKRAANVYARSDLADAWGRYLEKPSLPVEPPLPPQGPQDGGCGGNGPLTEREGTGLQVPSIVDYRKEARSF